jgi:hypothetical protein
VEHQTGEVRLVISQSATVIAPTDEILNAVKASSIAQRAESVANAEWIMQNMGAMARA